MVEGLSPSLSSPRFPRLPNSLFPHSGQSIRTCSPFFGPPLRAPSTDSGKIFPTRRGSVNPSPFFLPFSLLLRGLKREDVLRVCFPRNGDRAPSFGILSFEGIEAWMPSRIRPVLPSFLFFFSRLPLSFGPPEISGQSFLQASETSKYFPFSFFFPCVKHGCRSVLLFFFFYMDFSHSFRIGSRPFPFASRIFVTFSPLFLWAISYVTNSCFLLSLSVDLAVGLFRILRAKDIQWTFPFFFPKAPRGVPSTLPFHLYFAQVGIANEITLWRAAGG